MCVTIRVGATFKHFDLKWRDYESMRWQPLDAQAEPALSAALRQHAASAFEALKGCSYGRADFRVDKDGEGCDTHTHTHMVTHTQGMQLWKG